MLAGNQNSARCPRTDLYQVDPGDNRTRIEERGVFSCTHVSIKMSRQVLLTRCDGDSARLLAWGQRDTSFAKSKRAADGMRWVLLPSQ